MQSSYARILVRLITVYAILSAYAQFSETLEQSWHIPSLQQNLHLPDADGIWSWQGLCSCTSDSNLALKRGYYCSCNAPDQNGGNTNETSRQQEEDTNKLCLQENFERILVDACQNCDDRDCLVVCWGVPYRVWRKNTIHPQLEKCFRQVDETLQFTGGGVTREWSAYSRRAQYPPLPWSIGEDGEGGMRQCVGKPKTIHQITWADGPHRAVQHGRLTARRCGFVHHFVSIAKDDPKEATKGRMDWFTRIMGNITSIIEEQRPCDLFILHDAHDVLTLPNCDLLYEKYEPFNTDLVFTAELTSWPRKDVWTKMRAVRFSNENDLFPYLNSGIVVGRAWALSALTSWTVSVLKFHNDGATHQPHQPIFAEFFQLCHLQNCTLNPKLDSTGSMIACMSYLENHYLTGVSGGVRNGMTTLSLPNGNQPVLVHGNGPTGKLEFYTLATNLRQYASWPASTYDAWERLSDQACAKQRYGFNMNAHREYVVGSRVFGDGVADLVNRSLAASHFVQMCNMTEPGAQLETEFSGEGYCATIAIHISMWMTSRDNIFFRSINPTAPDEMLLNEAGMVFSEFARWCGFDAELLFQHLLAWHRFMVPCSHLHSIWADPGRTGDVVLLFHAALRNTIRHEKFFNKIQDLSKTESEWNKPSNPKASDILISFAATTDILESIQNRIFIWRCYAGYHGHHIQVDWRDPNSGRPQTVSEQFVSGNLLIYPYWPERLLTAYRALDNFEWVFIAESDQVIDPYCWKHGLHEIIKEHGNDAHIILTDFADHQTINEGTMFVRSSPIGRLFLEMAMYYIDLIGYSIAGYSFGLGQALLAISRISKGLAPTARPGDLAAASHHGDSGLFVFYVKGWHATMEHTHGPFGDRSSPWVKFLDSRSVNLNERIHHGLHKRAFLYHAFAVKDKDTQLNALLGFTPQGGRFDSCNAVYEHLVKYNKTKLWDVRFGFWREMGGHDGKCQWGNELRPVPKDYNSRIHVGE